MNADRSTDRFESILSRALALVDEESAALRECRPIDYGSMVARKNLIAYELEMLSQTARPFDLVAGARDQLASLRSKLHDNRALLDVHIGASREIAEILADLVRVAESDGTYHVPSAIRRRRP